MKAGEDNSVADALGISYVIDNSLQQLAKLGFLAFIVAWSLTLTSSSLFLNLPVSLILIVAALWLATHFNIEVAQPQQKRGKRVNAEQSHDRKDVPPSPFLPEIASAGAQRLSKPWREKVASGVVEAAWETLCGSILQEFVYDMWYSSLTPDREFPREIRRVLNTAFGELAGRARTCDLKGMLLRDVSELVIEQIELYRDTRDSIVKGSDPEVWENMPDAARDRALLAELKAERNLHPALYPADPSAGLGHYKVINVIADGMVAFLMERSDHAKLMMRSVARELLATCVLRSIIAQFTPYNINKLVLATLQKRVEKRPMDVEEMAAAAEAKVQHPDAAKGNWEFAERARQSIQQEESISKSAKVAGRRTPKPAASTEKQAHTTDHVEAGRQPSQVLKRVKSDNSLRQRHGRDSSEALITPLMTSSSDQGTAAINDTVRGGKEEFVIERAHSRTPPIGPTATTALDAASRSGGVTSTSGRSRGHSRAGSNASDVGNVMGLPAAAAQWRSKGGFIGRPRARVVAAELNSEGSKDVVIYKIRVADGTGEWTVSRRFRNFEALHRTLKEVPSFRVRMPAKRVFTHSQTVEFVEERRQQLDLYLQQILAEAALVGRQEVWEFLSAWSQVYGLDCDQSFLGSINASLRDVNVNVRRAMLDIADDFEAKRRKANASLAKLAGNALTAASSAEYPPLDSVEAVNGPSFTTSAPRFPSHGSSDSLQDRPVGGIKGERDASGEPRREEFQGHLLHYSYISPGAPGTVSAKSSPNSSFIAEPGKESGALANGSAKPPSGLATPERQQSTSSIGDAIKRSPAEKDPLRPSPQQVATAAAERLKQDSPAAERNLAADSGHIRLSGAQAASLSPQAATEKMEAVPPAVIPSSLAKAVEDRGDLAAPTLEEAAGVSAPLYDVVDVLFELQSRGYFRRQVYGVARQMLSLVAGGAIDEYILSQLKTLRQEHQLARLIQSLQLALWPGGIWFQRMPERQPAPTEPPPPRYVMTPESFLAAGTPPPIDAEEIKEAVRTLIMSAAPPALLRVVGRTAYSAGMQDLFDMMQSPTFVQQLGYGILKIFLLNLLPELRPLFRAVERAAPENASGKFT